METTHNRAQSGLIEKVGRWSGQPSVVSSVSSSVKIGLINDGIFPEASSNSSILIQQSPRLIDTSIDPSIKEIANRISQGDYHSIYSCRTLSSKSQLLSLALSQSDILFLECVIKFICATLNINVLVSLFKESSLKFALLHFLKFHNDILPYVNAVELYSQLDCPLEAAIHLFKNACLAPSHLRLNEMINCNIFIEKILSSNSSSNSPSSSSLLNIRFLYKQVQNEIKLLDTMTPIAANDNEKKFNLHIQRWNPIGAPISLNYYYFLLFHPDATKSISNYTSSFSISDKLSLWLKVRSAAGRKDWDTLKSLLKKRSWLSISSTNELGPLPFLDTAFEYNAPYNIKEYFAKSISSLTERYEACMRYHMYNIALDALIEKRERKMISMFLERLSIKYGSNHIVVQPLTKKANEVFKDGSIKWK